MKLPTHIKCICLKDGTPSAKMFVTVRMNTYHKNPFSFLVGPSDKHGEATISMAQIEREIRWTVSAFPMDYTGLKDFTGVISITPNSRQAIARTISGYESFKDTFSYPLDYEENLTLAKTFLDEHPGSSLSVAVEHDGEGIVVQSSVVTS